MRPEGPGPAFEPRVLRDEPMSRHLALGLGGTADQFFGPAHEAEVSTFLAALRGDVPVTWLGRGTRLVVRDRGVRGAVVCTEALDRLERVGDDELICGAGVACEHLARRCIAWGLGPGAFFAGLTGSLGGALVVNAGAFGDEVWRHVVSLLTVDRAGVRRERPACDFEVGYRFVVMPPGEGFLGARLHLRPGSADPRALNLLATPDAGASSERPGPRLFADPPGRSAARLIAAAGLAAASAGGARLDGHDANRVRLDAGTTADELEHLVDRVRGEVLRVHGVRLVPELHFVGQGHELPRPRPHPAAVDDRRRAGPAAPGEGSSEVERALARWNIVRFRPGAPAAGPAIPGRRAFLCSRQLGCPANLAWATRLHNYLTANGWTLGDADSADCLILVACIILVDYRADVRAAVRDLARRYPDKRLYVTGCFAPEDDLDAPNVTRLGMLDPDAFDRWFAPRVRLCDLSQASTPEADREVAALRDPRTLYERPFNVLVALGCLRHCHYCIEPRLFPRVQSVPLPQVIATCRDGIAKGYRNFQVGAADIASYGADLGLDVADLFAGLFDQVFGTRPDLGLGFKALEPAGFLRHFDRLRPYFAAGRVDWIYLPLESGSDRVLRSMNRRYRVADVLAVVRELRELAPALRIETDFVIAYPTETAADFEASLALLDAFDLRNLVPFERHEGTPAARLVDGFPPEERARRCDEAAVVARRQPRLWRYAFAPADDERSAPPMSAPPRPHPPRSLHVFQREPGCPINLSLATRFANYARANGFELCDSAEAADSVVIVSCSSLPTLREGVVSRVRELARDHPDKPVLVTCCFMPDDQVAARNVTYVPLSRPELIDAVFEPTVPFLAVTSGSTAEADLDVRTLREVRGPQAAFNRPYNVMVAVGCLNHCAFCSGKSMFPTVRSVPIDAVVDECLAGVRKGYTHLVLGASDLASYGRDLGTDVLELFSAVFERVLQGRPAVALGLKGIEPSGFLRFFERLRPYLASGRVAWIDMPVQSGSDAVLRSMNRRYRIADALALVRELRQLAPGIRLNTDVIFGYPTETAEDFDASLALFEHFDNVQMLRFQRHPETPSFALADVFDAAEDARRQAVVAEAIKTHSQLFMGVWTPEPASPDVGPPQRDVVPPPAGQPAAPGGYVRVRFVHDARASESYDVTVAPRRLGTRFHRAVGPYALEADVETPARGSVPLLRALAAALRTLAEVPPTTATLPRWQATIDEHLARNPAAGGWRCQLTFVPLGP